MKAGTYIDFGAAINGVGLIAALFFVEVARAMTYGTGSHVAPTLPAAMGLEHPVTNNLSSRPARLPGGIIIGGASSTSYVIALIDWGAVSAVGSVLTALVVAATALFGFNQLRLTRDQLEHLRRATQLDGAMKIFDDLHSPTYVEARHFVATELPKCLDDPAFRNEVELGMIWTENPDAVHHEQFILRTFETIGSHVQRGLLDREVIVDTTAIPIMLAWEHLREVVELQRRTIHPRMWENFEKLNDEAKAWFAEKSSAEQYRAWRGRVARHQKSGKGSSS